MASASLVSRLREQVRAFVALELVENGSGNARREFVYCFSRVGIWQLFEQLRRSRRSECREHGAAILGSHVRECVNAVCLV